MTDTKSRLTITESSGVTVVHFADRKILDEMAIDEIGKELNKIADEHDKIKMLLNFDSVEHLSSAALGMLISLNTKVSSANGALKLSDISKQIFEVFKITRLNKLFDIHDTAEQAMSTF